MKLNANVFKAPPAPRQTSKGNAGYDNARENIDPHIKTKVLSSREGSIEKVPVLGNDIVNKTYCDSQAIPSGGIIMWGGLVSAIPSGWHLCDGTAGTHDLRSKFIIGAAPGADPGATGGASTHTHTFTGSALATHDHTFTGSALATHTHTFTGSAMANHTHTFAGQALPDHNHGFTGNAMGTHFHTNIIQTTTLTGQTDSAVTGGNVSSTTSAVRQGTGAGIVCVTSVSWIEAGHVHNLTAFINNLSTWLGLCQTSADSAGTPSGTISATSAGNISGSISSDSAGTPAGSNSGTSGGTPAGTISAKSAGTPAGSNSTESNLPPYYALCFIQKL